MIDTMKPYPEYKESGLPWIGSIPKHWDSLPHRAIFEEIKEQGHVNEPLLSVTIGRGIIRQEDLLANSSKKDSSNLDKSKYKLVDPGDIAYNKMRAWQGSVGVSKYRGIVSPAYIVQRLRGDLKPDYFHYLFRTPGFAKEAERWSYGITSDQWSLRPQHFKMIYSCVPPLYEQELIVGFLRKLDRQVLRFIRNRWRLINLLNEQKQAIINRAVTRGLNADAPLKHSKVDWLGDIPESWTLKRFKYVVSIRSGQVDPKIAPYRDWVLIAPEHIEKHTGVIRLRETAHEQGAISGKYQVEPGEVIYSKIRPALRKAAIAEEKCLCSADMYPLAPRRSEILPEYLLLLLLYGPATRYLIDYSMRVAMPKVNRDALGNCWLWYPDVDTQREIMQSLKDKLLPLNTSLDRAQREINLIREYRTRLISDVVTGKMDVRHVSPPPVREDLEEMVESLEPLNDQPDETDEESMDGEVFHADD
ncbi:restriction endonuclease subunit S [Desulfatitalea tepidiphila]|uniref:restriction endonuclease subunit S n=1 Tax=Desulfatitalea tepidiphila TaxID=1185843 RepID=UPI0006B57E4F|nr:restriction endonuclease subunit S [Desulfatitalea tepidiphila]